MAILHSEIAALNRQFEKAEPVEIISKVLELNLPSVVTTNFRPYEAAILHAASVVKSDIPVIWCDTGYNTPNTYRHAEQLIQQLNLNIFRYVPLRTAAHRDALTGIPEIEDPEHAVFTAEVKLEPFQRAMAEHKPEVWLTNLRKGQTAHRDRLDVLSLSKDGVLKVSPFYHWSDTRLDGYLSQHGLPNEFKYFDPTKVLSNRECGLHQ